MFFAYAYLWRHHIELQLKYLLDRACAIWGEVPARTGHRLGPLNESLRIILDRNLRYSHIDTESAKHFARLLNDLVLLDPDGQALRYERSTKGDVNLTDVEYVNIGAFHRCMLALANYLDAIDVAVDREEESAAGQRALEQNARNWFS